MRARLVLVVLALVGAAACSQTDALAPVGGAAVADLRYAVNDVLVDAGVDLLQAPVCSGTGADIACVGKTATGKPVTATATAADGSTVEVTVDGTVVYSGSVQDVLNRAGTEVPG